MSQFAEVQAQQIQQGQQQPQPASNPIVHNIAPIFQNPVEHPVVQETPKEAPNTNPDKITVDANEYAQVVQRARNFETITADPQANVFLTNYFREMAIQQQNQTSKLPPTPEIKSDSQPIDKGVNNPMEQRVASLEQGLAQGLKYLQEIQTSMGRVALDAFRARNTDFDQYSSDARQLMTEIPGLSVQKAYELAKRIGPRQSSNSSTASRPAANTVENGRAGVPEQSDIESQGQQRILDRKATPGDGYIAEAYKVAQQMHGGR